MQFPDFWFEGNLYFGWVTSLEDMETLFEQYKDDKTPEELLTTAMGSTWSDYPRFGYYMCDGDKSLKQYLEEHNITYPIKKGTENGTLTQ